MRKRHWARTAAALLAAAVVVGWSATAVAGPRHASGTEVEKRVEQVMTSITWTNDIDELRDRATKNKKLIFWLQLVGELDGGL